MQFRAQAFSRRTSSATLPARLSSLVATAAATSLLASLVFVSLLGCGSGVVNSIPQQAAAVPVATANGPQLGYVWLNSDQTLRPILGVTGASQVGQSVVPSGLYVNASTSAAAGLALLQAADGSFDLMTLPSGSPVSLGLTLPSGARIRLSPSAVSALIYSPGATAASLVTGLPSTPKVQSVAANGPIGDSAVSDTGAVSLEVAQGTGVAVTVIPLGGHSVPLSNIGASGGMSFLPGKDDLLFADAVANSLVLIRSTTTAPATQSVPASALLDAPSAVGVSGSGRWAVIANSGSATLVRVDLASLANVQVACSCKPTLSAPLADDGAFRVTDLAGGPNWLVDATPSSPRTLFIPALAASARTSAIASAGRK